MSQEGRSHGIEMAKQPAWRKGRDWIARLHFKTWFLRRLFKKDRSYTDNVNERAGAAFLIMQKQHLRL
jgi:hypothetical protein